MKYYYQLVEKLGKYGPEFVIYEARKSGKKVEIQPRPFILVGNTPQEIVDTLECIMKDINENTPIKMPDCSIFEDDLMYDDDPEAIFDDENDLFRVLGI